VITHSDAQLVALRGSVDRWFAGALLFGIVTALIGAAWLAGHVSRPLSRLADLTTKVDLDRLDVAFATERVDEVGDLSRLLDAMTRRLRSSAARIRAAEHRATIGDVARQVNHDVKNGLVPIRHVLRHLEQVERDDPHRLGAVFAERRSTLDASVQYLDALARNYARLSRPIAQEPCDLNALARVAAASAAVDDRVSVRLELDPRAPVIRGDALVVRRILDNLVSNAIDAVASTGGVVTIGTGGPDAHATRILVSDTGSGMTEEQFARAFDDFQTSKPNGTGLGLSIVRRLTSDLGATLRVDTAPNRGTTVEVVFAAVSERPAVTVR
jgi:two-component system NtrC family sensor kinase